MTKQITVIHDTIVIVKKDTIVKVVELVSKVPESKTSSFVQWFNDYSNVSVFFGTVATVGALIVAMFAIYKASKDNRHQLLVGKLEEIFELVNTLNSDYIKIHEVYILFEKAQLHKMQYQIVIANIQSEKKLKELPPEIDLNKLYEKTERLNVLSNAYLGKSSKFLDIGSSQKKLKFNTLGFVQIYNSILIVLLNKSLVTKNSIISGILPSSENMDKLTTDISSEIIKTINYGKNNRNYRKYRDGTFSKKYGIKDSLEDN